MNFRIILVGVITVLILALGSCSFTHVTPGFVGIQVDNLGNGVQADAKPVGWYFTPPSVSIHEYPVSTKNYTWTRSTTEQNAANEEFQFQDKNGLGLTADVSVTYHIDQARAPKLYSQYRMDIEDVVNGPLHNAVRNALMAEAANMGVEEIYGAGKTAMMARALTRVQAIFGPQGLDVETLNWASGVRVPDAVMTQINQKIANEQAALAAQANVAKAKAEADAKVAEATGEAEAMRVRGEAIRTNPEILQQEAIKKWQGGVPQVISGGATTPFINIK